MNVAAPRHLPGGPPSSASTQATGRTSYPASLLLSTDGLGLKRLPGLARVHLCQPPWSEADKDLPTRLEPVDRRCSRCTYRYVTDSIRDGCNARHVGNDSRNVPRWQIPTHVYDLPESATRARSRHRLGASVRARDVSNPARSCVVLLCGLWRTQSNWLRRLRQAG